jgi:hypothetical protein
VPGTPGGGRLPRGGRGHGQQRGSEQDGHDAAQPESHCHSLLARRRAPGAVVQVVMVRVCRPAVVGTVTSVPRLVTRTR